MFTLSHERFRSRTQPTCSDLNSFAHVRQCLPSRLPTALFAKGHWTLASILRSPLAAILDAASSISPVFATLTKNTGVGCTDSRRASLFRESFQRVRSSIIPLRLRPLCFHTLTHSFASSKRLSIVFSISCTLFQQNTRVWGTLARHSPLPPMTTQLTFNLQSIRRALTVSDLAARIRRAAISFIINTYKTDTKPTTLTTRRINTYAKPRGEGSLRFIRVGQPFLAVLFRVPSASRTGHRSHLLCVSPRPRVFRFRSQPISFQGCGACSRQWGVRK